MGQTCCGGTPDHHELNASRLQKPQGDGKSLDDVARTLKAVLTVQRIWRGMITRRIMKEQYGFVTRGGMGANHRTPIYTQTST